MNAHHAVAGIALVVAAFLNGCASELSTRPIRSERATERAMLGAEERGPFVSAVARVQAEAPAAALDERGLDRARASKRDVDRPRAGERVAHKLPRRHRPATAARQEGRGIQR